MFEVLLNAIIRVDWVPWNAVSKYLLNAFTLSPVTGLGDAF